MVVARLFSFLAFLIISQNQCLSLSPQQALQMFFQVPESFKPDQVPVAAAAVSGGSSGARPPSSVKIDLRQILGDLGPYKGGSGSENSGSSGNSGNTGNNANCKARVRGQLKDCVFPFTYQGSTYHRCTTVNSENGRAWCATRVNRKGVAVNGNWGDCECTSSTSSGSSSFPGSHGGSSSFPGSNSGSSSFPGSNSGSSSFPGSNSGSSSFTGSPGNSGGIIGAILGGANRNTGQSSSSSTNSGGDLLAGFLGGNRRQKRHTSNFNHYAHEGWHCHTPYFGSPGTCEKIEHEKCESTRHAIWYWQTQPFGNFILQIYLTAAAKHPCGQLQSFAYTICCPNNF